MADGDLDPLTPERGALRWSVATVAAVGLHLGALHWLLVRSDAPATQAAPEAMVMIDLPPAPQLPPLESVEQAATEEVVSEPPPEMVEAPPVEAIADTPPPEIAATDAAVPLSETTEPEFVQPSDVFETVETAPPETVEAVPPPPDMAPPSPVALETAEVAEIDMLPVTEVKPKPAPKPPKAAPKKPPKAEPRPPADAQLAGAGSGRETEDVLMAYRSAIRKAILARRRAADAAGAVGRATVSLTIGRDGGVVGLSVSGSGDVAAAARRLMQRVGSFPAVPAALAAPFTVTVPVEFQRR